MCLFKELSLAPLASTPWPSCSRWSWFFFLCVAGMVWRVNAMGSMHIHVHNKQMGYHSGFLYQHILTCCWLWNQPAWTSQNPGDKHARIYKQKTVEIPKLFVNSRMALTINWTSMTKGPCCIAGFFWVVFCSPSSSDDTSKTVAETSSSWRVVEWARSHYNCLLLIGMSGQHFNTETCFTKHVDDTYICG